MSARADRTNDAVYTCFRLTSFHDSACMQELERAFQFVHARVCGSVSSLQASAQPVNFCAGNPQMRCLYTCLRATLTHSRTSLRLHFPLGPVGWPDSCFPPIAAQPHLRSQLQMITSNQQCASAQLFMGVMQARAWLTCCQLPAMYNCEIAGHASAGLARVLQRASFSKRVCASTLGSA